MKKIGVVTLLASFALAMAGCSSGGQTEEPATDSSKAASKGNEKVEISAVGSTALQPLVENIADIYMTDNPNYTIVVQGGGSGTGLSQIVAGAVDIGNSDIFAEEKDGIDASELVDNQIAVVGMAPVVNKDAGVEDLTTEQLIDVFTGKVTNWKDLGGKDQDILVVNRAQGSGTRATFEKWALDGAQSIASQEQDSSGTVKKIVAETPGAVSYLAFSYLDDTLTTLKVDGVEATTENVATNDWKIWSYEHMYTRKDAKPEVKEFIDYILSDDVQKNVVEKLNYIPITSMDVTRDVDGNIK
ncbi:phosphate ABC transporter substrate-binding protein PstS family protein [Vagococcus sp.]|uniref:phosphate ABC transporter substrate-binding protein PstS family protein n=1 Tax=Vagococcus sp. TaxID=1933889 RepID=UPI000EBC1EEF|nr:phosphate ABC transporter substrate-binding protein PstS family protein [Vagococcus sp.]HCT95968.1 phosphate ABC transporter substrate-binding protein [Vagococcus sp.]